MIYQDALVSVQIAGILTVPTTCSHWKGVSQDLANLSECFCGDIVTLAEQDGMVDIVQCSQAGDWRENQSAYFIPCPFHTHVICLVSSGLCTGLECTLVCETYAEEGEYTVAQ